MRRLVIVNRSSTELGIMLEPCCDREDVPPGGQVTIEGDFTESDLIIDFHDQNFLSIWTPPESKMQLAVDGR